jgi:hypothetical protein
VENLEEGLPADSASDGGATDGMTVSSGSRRAALRTLAVGGGVAVAASLLRPSQAAADTLDLTRPKLARPADSQMVTVPHGSAPDTPRPAGAGSVYWKGDVAPVNGANGDLWYDTSGDTP